MVVSRFKSSWLQKRKCGSILLDRSRIRLNRSKIASPLFFAEFQTSPSLQKCLGFHLNFSTYKRETLATFRSYWKDFCVTLCEIWEVLYLLTTQESTRARTTIKHLVKHNCCIKIITDVDLKPLNGMSKSQARWLVLV